jgi:formyl-CoA transferase
VGELDALIGQWTASRTVDEVLTALETQGVPAGRIYTVADIAQDPHYRARGMITTEQIDGHEMLLSGIVPKLSRTPGTHVRPAPRVGQDSRPVLRRMGLSDEQIDELEALGVVASNQEVTS